MGKIYPCGDLIISHWAIMILCLPGWYTHIKAQAFSIMNAFPMYSRANKLPAAIKATSSYLAVHTQTKIHPVMMYYRQLEERQFVTGCNLIYYQINTLLSSSSCADILWFVVQSDVGIVLHMYYDAILWGLVWQKQISRAGISNHILQYLWYVMTSPCARYLLLTILWGGISQDDVIKWKNFPRYWPFVRGIPRSPVNSPHKGQWRGALMFSLSVWKNGWVNNREAGDLRRHRAHYDVTVMCPYLWYLLMAY